MDIFWEPKTSFKIVFSDSRTLFINPKKEVQADIVLSDEIKEERFLFPVLANMKEKIFLLMLILWTGIRVCYCMKFLVMV